MKAIRMTERIPFAAALMTLALIAARPAYAQFGDLGGTKTDATSNQSQGDGKLVVDPPPIPLTSTVKDLAINIPQGFGHGAEARFPSSVSPFVVVGKNGFDNDLREVWDLRTKTKVGSMRGKADYDKVVSLSADGTMFAGKPGFRDTVEVRLTKTGKLIQTIASIPPWTDFLDFGFKDQIIAGNLRNKQVKAWSIKSGSPLFDLQLPAPVKQQTIAFSPGRRYMTTYSEEDSTLRVLDLSASAKVAAEFHVPKGQGDAFNPDCKGVAFSNDGTDIAAIFEQFGKVRVVAWSVATCQQTNDFTIDSKSTDKVTIPAFYEDRGIQWLPSKDGFLAFGSSIIDRQSGKKVWTLPFDNQNFTVSPRRLIDNERVLIVFGGGKILRVAPIPYDKVQAAMKIARAGGNASDAALPALKTADQSGVRTISYSAGATSWSVVPDTLGSAKRFANRPITLKTKLSETIALFLSNSEAGQILVAGSPSAFGRPDTAEGISRWADRFDLTSGKYLGRADIPSVSEVVAFSPDASKLLTRTLKTHDRLDVFDVTGKPIAGWRPYASDSGEAADVTFAAFIDANKIVTLNKSGRLVLWSLPQVKAIYSVNDAFQGTPSLSPNRTTLAGFSGDRVRFVDTATGELKGEVAIASASVGTRIELKASAFRRDGGEWAGIFSHGNLVRVDVKSGKVVSEFRSPVLANSLEYGAPGYLLADGKNLIDLVGRRAFWAYNSGVSGDSSPDGRHWFACAWMPEAPAVLAAIVMPEQGMERMLAMMADQSTPAVVRPGSNVSLQLEFSGPPRKAEEFRKAVYDLTAAKLQAAGLRVASGQSVTFVVRVQEKSTGETLQMQKIGMGAAPGGPFNKANILSIPVVDLECTLDVNSNTGKVPCANTTLGMRTFFHVLHLPPGETDVEKYLKDRQWDGLKYWIETTSMPYFLSKSGSEVVRLPGFTDLNQLYGRTQ